MQVSRPVLWGEGRDIFLPAVRKFGSRRLHAFRPGASGEVMEYVDDFSVERRPGKVLRHARALTAFLCQEPPMTHGCRV